MFSLLTAMLVLSTAGEGPARDVARSGAAADVGGDVVQRWTFDSAEDLRDWTIGHDIENLRIEQGVLRMEMTGADAYLFGPPLEAPLDGCTVRLRMRCDRDGQTQVYWTTPEHPQFGEGRGQTLFVPGFDPAAREGSDEGWVKLTFPIGTPDDAGRMLTRVRVDPCNGNETGRVEIDWIELLRPPPVYEVRLSGEGHQIDPGWPGQVRVQVRQRTGRAAEEVVEVLPADGEPRRLPMTGRPALTAVGLKLERTGVHRERVRVRGGEGRITHDLETSLIVGRDERLPLIPALRSDRVRLDFVPATAGRAASHRRDAGATPQEGATPQGDAIQGTPVGAARWMVATGGGEWSLAGWLLPLIDLSVRGPDGSVIQRHPSLSLLEYSERSARLGGPIEGLPGWEASISFELKEENRLAHLLQPSQLIPFIEVTAVLMPPDGGELLDFAGPVVLVDRKGFADPLERFAIFGGLEFLEPGWESSSERAVGRHFAERWAPHPYKITLPVMAVESAGVTSALMWQPLDEWEGPAAQAQRRAAVPSYGESMPAATFASPNHLDGQANHLLKLSVPGIPRWRQENELLAHAPYQTRKDHPLTLRYRLLAEADLPVVMAGRKWYELYGAPPPPPPPTSRDGKAHDDATWYDIVARNYGETMYWEDEQGWRAHWWHVEKSSSYIPFMAGTLLAHAAETGDKRWVERTGLAGKTVIDATGTLAGRLSAEEHVRGLLSSMRPDGTWPFVNTEKMKADTRWQTKGEYETLGEDGSTSLGTCVQPALAILRYAKLSGRQEYIDAGLKALEAMKQFRVPRGAQVWEVHQQIPDIRAASLAISANRIGYELTGDSQWLQEALYWAYAGLPFIYSWHVPVERSPGAMLASTDPRDPNRVRRSLSEGFQNPDRQIMPYATVPVLGPTFYVINWFGVVVQWLGFEWAMHVIELDETISMPAHGRKRDQLLRYLADGVIASGLQQVFDRPPWVGMYPDVWDTQGNIATGAYISAMLPMRVLQAQGRIPDWTQPWTRVMRPTPDTSWHVSGWGVPVIEGRGALNLRVVAHFLAGEPNELIIAGADPPRQVLVDGERLEQRRKADPSAPGWHYDAARQAVVARFIQEDETAEIRVNW